MFDVRTPLELLRPPAARCLGAFFSTYAFDEVFFESVLAALLPIHADPESDRRMYLAEARRRLRETPVVVVADGQSYSGGHRLPFHLNLSERRMAQHARFAFTLFEDHARLIVGSANLTPTGFGRSADLAAMLRLDLKRDTSLMHHILEVGSLIGAKGEGWERLVQQCESMFAKPKATRPKPENTTKILVSAEKKSVLEQFLKAIPKSARISAVHLSADAQPEDDGRFGVGAMTVLTSWLKGAKQSELNVAVAWSDNSVVPPAVIESRSPQELEGFLIAQVEGVPGRESIAWSVVERVEKSKIYLSGRKSALQARALKRVMEHHPPKLWAVEEVTGSGQLEALGILMEEVDIHWWLYPENQMHEGALRRRPFHAKFLAVCTQEKGKKYTHLLLGAPNLARSQSPHDDLREMALHLRLNGHHHINDICTSLIPAPGEGFFLEDRVWPNAATRPIPPLRRALYDAEGQVLSLEWTQRAPECRLSYLRDTGDDEIFKGSPRQNTSVPNFFLSHGATELRVRWGEQQALVPIDIVNISSLRADEPQGALDLKSIVALHGDLRSVVHEGRLLSAQDVFLAQKNLADELCSTGLQWGAFEVAVNGPIGVQAFAEAIMQSADEQRAEAWLYGLELCKLLDDIDWSKSPFKQTKKQTIETFVGDFRARLTEIASREPWSQAVSSFYGGRK